MRPSLARCGLQLWIGEEKGPNNPGPSVSSRRYCYSGWAATMGMDGFGGRGSSRPQFSYRAAPSGFLCPQRKHTVVMFNFRGFPRQRPQLTQAYPHDMASSPCRGFCGCGRLREVPARGWMGRHWRAIVACFSAASSPCALSSCLWSAQYPLPQTNPMAVRAKNTPMTDSSGQGLPARAACVVAQTACPAPTTMCEAGAAPLCELIHDAEGRQDASKGQTDEQDEGNGRFRGVRDDLKQKAERSAH